MNYTANDVQRYVAQYQAILVQTKDEISWYRMGDGRWLAVRSVGHGWYEVRILPANACGC